MQGKSDNRYKDIIDSIPGLICQMRFKKDGTRYWSYMSPAGLNMLGLDKDLIGDKVLVEYNNN